MAYTDLRSNQSPLFGGDALDSDPASGRNRPFSQPIHLIANPIDTQPFSTKPTDRMACVSAEPAFVGLNARFSTG
jgi:hypothetical protein